MPARTIATLAATAIATTAAAGPDIIVGDITGTVHYGQVGGIHAYAIAPTLCNVGDAPVGYSITDADHPIVISNLYRIHNNRFEQIGMSWAYNTTIPIETAVCGTCTPSGSFQSLGVGCSDPHGAGLAGSQQGLSRRSEVEPHAGVIAFPQDGIQTTGDAIFKRLQVAESDLPAFPLVELMVVAPDDSAAGNTINNTSWRQGFITASLAIVLSGPTAVGQPAIFAWAAEGATVVAVDVPGDGRLYVGSLAVDNADGTWTYHYAVHNQSCDRGVNGFSVVFTGVEATDLIFHDVDYHSGEPYDGADWDATADIAGASWSTDSYIDNHNANAIRWGTTYSFSFTAASPPSQANASLALFAPGTGFNVNALVVAPASASACPADLAAPFGTLNVFDLMAYIDLYNAQDPAADLVSPFGTFNIFDIAEFVNLYNDGCVG